MRKILFGLLCLIFISDLAFAAKVNLSKTGTPWVWRVEDGSDGSFLLMEDGTYLVSEAGTRFGVESSSLTYALLENESKLVFENGNGVLLEVSTNPGEGTMLYRSLVGQGWEVTDSAATLPQAIQGTDAALAYDLLALENGSHMLFENTNTLRLEN